MAEALAAVQQNITKNYVDNSFIQQEIPAIIFINTIPTLYRITITAKLLGCLKIGSYPKGHRTFIRKLVRDGDNTKGIEDLESRRIIFKHFEAFKNVITEMNTRNNADDSEDSDA